jgi:hypothetical protein
VQKKNTRDIKIDNLYAYRRNTRDIKINNLYAHKRNARGKSVVQA